MKILEASRELNKIEQYLMTLDNGIKPMKEVPDGTSIEVSAWIIFEDENSDGELNEITSILTPNKEAFAFQSATFKRSLMNIHNLMAGEQYSIIKCSGKTKAGRDYIDCRLDVTQVNYVN